MQNYNKFPRVIVQYLIFWCFLVELFKYGIDSKAFLW